MGADSKAKGRIHHKNIDKSWSPSNSRKEPGYFLSFLFCLETSFLYSVHIRRNMAHCSWNLQVAVWVFETDMKPNEMACFNCVSRMTLIEQTDLLGPIHSSSETPNVK